MTKDIIVKHLEDIRAAYIKVVGPSMNVVLSDKNPDELVLDFTNLFETLPPGRFIIEMRANKNDSKGAQQIPFRIGEGTTNISGLEGIGGPSPWQLMQENEALKDKIRNLEFQTQLKDQERKFAEQMEKLKEKDGGAGLEKLSGIIGQVAQIINAAKGQPAPAVGSRSPVRPQAPPVSLSGLPDEERTGEPADENERVGADLQDIAAALGPEKFIETIAALADKAKQDPDGFAAKLDAAKNFL